MICRWMRTSFLVAREEPSLFEIFHAPASARRFSSRSCSDSLLPPIASLRSRLPELRIFASREPSTPDQVPRPATRRIDGTLLDQPQCFSLELILSMSFAFGHSILNGLIMPLVGVHRPVRPERDRPRGDYEHRTPHAEHPLGSPPDHEAEGEAPVVCAETAPCEEADHVRHHVECAGRPIPLPPGGSPPR